VDLTTVEHERAELDAVLSSSLFRKAPNQSRLLRYLCDRHFEHEIEQPKEHQIAIEALGRNDSFDQRENSIVRVEAYRLRRRLQRYYESEGRLHPLRIALDPGQYRVRFVEAKDCPAEILPDLEPEEVAQPDEPPPHRRIRWIALSAAALAIIAAAIVVILLARRPKPGNVTAVPSALTAEGGAALPSGPAIRILAGYDRATQVDRLAQVWTRDRWFHGGEAVACPRLILARTPDATIYRHCRMGNNFSYDIPLKPGYYEMRLYFGPVIRPWSLIDEATQRYPIVLLMNGNGNTINLNFAADGAVNSIPDVRVFRDVTPAADGSLHLLFSQAGQYAFVNAIEILPSVRGRMLPIRITASSYFHTDIHGNVWPPERFVRGGLMVERRDEVTGTADPDLFSAERYGDFDYLIPVAQNGTYAVTLGFAETWFGPKLPGGDGPDSRLFDVSCNGVPLVKSINVFKEAGGSDRALLKTFHNLHADADGKLRLTFKSVRNNAMVNFIEVDDESKQP